MIKKTLYFGTPIYLSLRNAQLVLRKPDADKLEESFKQDTERTIPIEDIGV
ncbi:MAG: type II CRISPR-associated endonuclease Cas1, partial [Bacteroidaceae bacterium]|nr:type II CRISPR-associated endonuclease Cas1 [Prevotellaceae bacterium]MDY5759850.1 type II CRISPR-associated endonuclease Cas1 [Bacteroidaceae bacterium]